MAASRMFPNFDKDAPNCVDCPQHETRITPDPDDWFCDDDITVSCKAADGRAIAPGIRPQFEREYCMVPKWCPKRARAGTADTEQDATQNGRADGFPGTVLVYGIVAVVLFAILQLLKNLS